MVLSVFVQQSDCRQVEAFKKSGRVAPNAPVALACMPWTCQWFEQAVAGVMDVPNDTLSLGDAAFFMYGSPTLV